jgi:hypothetical protein
MLSNLVIAAQETIEWHRLIIGTCFEGTIEHNFLASAAGAVFLFFNTLIESLEIGKAHG